MIMANFTEIHGTQYIYSSKRNCDLNQCCVLDEIFFIFLELAIILIQCCLVYLCFTSWFLNYSMLIEGYDHRRQWCLWLYCLNMSVWMSAQMKSSWPRTLVISCSIVKLFEDFLCVSLLIKTHCVFFVLVSSSQDLCYGNLESGNQLMRYKNIVWHIQTVKPAWNEKIYTLKQSFPFFLSNKMIFIDIYKKS